MKFYKDVVGMVRVDTTELGVDAISGRNPASPIPCPFTSKC